jgi:hypothetical protein
LRSIYRFLELVELKATSEEQDNLQIHEYFA